GLMKKLHRRCPKLPLVVLSADLEMEGILNIFTAGVRGYLTREVALPGLVAVLELAGRGGFACCPTTAAVLQTGRSVGAQALSDREAAIVERLAQGAGNADMEHYVGQVMDKTGKQSRAGLAAWWSRRNLIPK
ncbi:MAG: hypothetical protein MI924_35965, partial [Chloroflexales bacterium]|nr:hypothetical protein [Chloroflexales bacterium]